MTAAKATYTPQPDITAFELAKCIELAFNAFTSVIIDKDQYDTMDEGVRRHFTIQMLDPAPDPEGPLE